jgi:hypothetical protein
MQVLGLSDKLKGHSDKPGFSRHLLTRVSMFVSEVKLMGDHVHSELSFPHSFSILPSSFDCAG